MRQDHPTAPPENRLLAALPDEVRWRIAPDLEMVEFGLGDVLYESGQRLTHVHFPVDCSSRCSTRWPMARLRRSA